MQANKEKAGALLAGARRSGTRVVLPAELSPRSAAEAYAIQDAIGAALTPGGTQACGWKVGAPDPHTEPNAAPIYEVITGPVRIPAGRLNMIGVETEIAAVFGRALPPRSAPYSADEVIHAVRELRVAIEVCDSRLENWSSASDLTKLADHQTNFALVLGDAVTRFDAIDFRSLVVRTRVNGSILKEGVGCHAVGNPLTLLPWLANHARTRGGLIAGAAVTTGAWLGMHFVEPGSTVVAEFSGLGSAQVEFCS
jgi:2-keto-4-pentenoate hydratase